MVQWSNNDLAVIEEALKEAMANQADYQAVLAYQEVLQKLQGNPGTGDALTANVGEPVQDGFRYDYDDSSNV
ncbi:hypothetical protein [Ammoniphilus sp. CFH 90114]|uniref:hypothetical protein n=1 Tax=Ammoniphilus sp. CFH 90114 TaxID=2493665 RepID=UPI00100F158B|nr:hypothetical protein [Ammoniphilus sp. CFH 90114]RXT05681.1 hypothetical protein EIZ39_16350 [Ammoniphilus sp. CFH 90114]